MQPSQARMNLIVGAFVLGGFALLTVLLLFVGGKGEPFARRILVKSRFTNTGGLLEGAPVRLAGVDIGTVYSVEFADVQTEKPVVVTLEISSTAASRIARDAKASIRQLGLLGDKYVEIIQGNVALGTIQEARYIEGTPPFDIADVYDDLQEIVANIREASGKIGEAVELYASPETAANVKQAMAATKTLLEEIRDGKGFLHAIIYEDAHEAMLKDLGVVSANLKTSSNYLEGLLAEVRQGKGSLHQLIYGEQLANAMTELATFTKAANEVIGQVQKGESLAHRVFYEEGDKRLGAGVAQVLADLRVASGDIKQITQTVRDGKGTVGALIQDDALYEDLRILFGGAGRSSWLRYIIRSMVEENEDRAVKDLPK